MVRSFLFATLLTGLLAGPALAESASFDETQLRDILLGEYPGADLSSARYAAAPYDLDGDGEDEWIVYVFGPDWCGSAGCNAYVLSHDGHGYDVVTSTSVTRLPIGVMETSSNGWRDLFVSIGGGGMPWGAVPLRYDGSSYPSNPTVVDEEVLDAPPGEILIADDVEGESLD